MSKAMGSKFEQWLEEVLNDLGYKDVRQNVIYSSNKSTRQVDVEYKTGLVICRTMIVECKYSSNGQIQLKPRGLNKKKEGKKEV